MGPTREDTRLDVQFVDQVIELTKELRNRSPNTKLTPDKKARLADALLTALARADKIYRKGTDYGYAGVSEAIAGFIRFATEAELITGRKCSAPVFALRHALTDARDGNPPTLFASKTVAHRPKARVATSHMRLLAAVAVERLVQTRAAKIKTTREGARLVAKRLLADGFRQQRGKIEGGQEQFRKTVESWIGQAKHDPAARAEIGLFVRHARVADAKTVTAIAIQNGILDDLISWLRRIRAQDFKSLKSLT